MKTTKQPCSLRRSTSFMSSPAILQIRAMLFTTDGLHTDVLEMAADVRELGDIRFPTTLTDGFDEMMGQSGIGSDFGRSLFFDDTSLSKSVIQLAAEVSDHNSDWLLPLDDFPTPPKPINRSTARPLTSPPKPKKPPMASSMYGGLYKPAAPRPTTAPATAVVAPQIKPPRYSPLSSPRDEEPKKSTSNASSAKSEYEALKEEMEKRERELQELVLSSNEYSWCRSYSRCQTPVSQNGSNSSNTHTPVANIASPSFKDSRLRLPLSSRPTSRAGTPSGSTGLASRIPVPSSQRRHTSVAPGLRYRRS